MAKLDSQRLIFGLYLLVLIVIGEVVLIYFNLPAWPAFMVMIFFLIDHMDVKKAHHILIGGCFGIICIILTKLFIVATARVLGVNPAQILFIVLIVYAIVAFGEILPVLFNNYAFMFLTISGLAVTSSHPNPLVWIGVELVGGGIFIAGIIGIMKIMGVQARKKADTSVKPA